MIDVVKAVGDGDDHCGNGEGVEKSGEKSAGKTKKQGNYILRLHPDQDAGEGKAQEILHEVDAGDHEDQQQDDLEVVQRLLIDGFRMGHADHHRLQRQQAAGRQGVAFQGHGQGEDEFADQYPAGDEWVIKFEEKRVDDQEQQDCEFVPLRGVAEKVPAKGLGIRSGHRCFS